MYQSILQNVPLKNHCTFHVGGNAKYLVRASDIDSLLRALELTDRVCVLGKGSKVLISDEGFDGTVIILSGASAHFGSSSCYVDSGLSLPACSKLYQERGLTGLEWACGIPGSIGGALKLNAGAYGSEMAKITLFVDVLRFGRVVRLRGEQCGFAYRHSGFYPEDIIIGAGLRAEKGDKAQISRRRDEYSKKRLTAQPVGRSCGSVFKAGEKPAYQYIRDAGLAGAVVGGAKISEKHANFILNTGKARARDIYTLIQTAKAEVYSGQKIRLAEEVIYIGDF